VRRGYETSMAEKLAHDLEWIADRSVRLYLRTLVVTAWRVLRQSLSRSRAGSPRGRGRA
jgi:lipopolysaccharide/colanic/teichoic acid biosynthesis glycosyltransferase